MRIVGAARTPVGSFRGALAPKSAPQLGAVAIRAAMERAELDSGTVTEAIMGNVLSAGVGQAPARQAALGAGLPESTVCTTVNKVCASGLKAVMLGAQSVALGAHPAVVAGGMESMSNAPYYLPTARAGFGYGHQTVLDAVLQDGLTCARHRLHMGECAEETAAKYDLGREAQDAYAMQSYRRAAEAWAAGRFAAEVVPVSVEGRRGATTVVREDEEYAKVDFAKFSSLKPVFASQGTITAANASTLNDGAAAVVLAHVEALAAGGAKPMARILAMADAECEPKFFTTAPALAIPRALEGAGLRPEDIDLWEINEAFSLVALANIKLLNLDPSKVNTVGGAVALGHPIGSSGCRLLVTLLHQLRPGQRGCVAICNGGGGASALVIEKL